jgi:D-alanyl-lipoteichoic acid acyltransferase DltB (MBOAT superfamily)
MQEKVSMASKTSPADSTESLNAQIKPLQLLQLLLPLALIGLVVYFFHLEMEIRLINIISIIIPGFILFAMMPLPWRLPFLFLLNLAAMFRLLGLIDGSILALLGLLLFGLANLPTGLRTRIALVAISGGLLAAFRADWLPFVQSKTILPILGSIFMFRMILYLYEIQFEKQPASFWKKLNYFFLLPNLVFLIFPVVDYSTFVRNYYSRPAFETYRRGVMMMANGIFHLLLYRLIYYYLMPAPSDVRDTFSLLQFMATSYALIVRLAGIFHFSAGVICLFGFKLPPAFEHYFFANSFSDLWRRINIYWRDFVTKVFYFPIYFRLKRYGATYGLALSVLIVFAINWFLHGYQWFWIRGTFPLTFQDMAFWGVLGIAVAANSVLQAKRRPIPPQRGRFSQPYAWRNAFSVIGIFSFMSVLWSFWTSNSASDWLAIVARGAPRSLTDVTLPLLGLLALASLGVLLQYTLHWNSLKKQPLSLAPTQTFWLANAGLAALVCFGQPNINQQLETRLGMDFEPVRYAKLNAFDREQLYKGYYETLIASNNNLNSRLWELERAKPEGWKTFNSLGISIRRDDIMLKDMMPNQKVPFKGALLTTNSYGLRDREYSLENPPNTLRIALLGGSIEMGAGVNTDETFENYLEDELNSSNFMEEGYQVEILNFAVSGNHLFQNLAVCEQKVAPFLPDAIVYVAHSNEQYRVISSLQRAYVDDRDLVYPYLKSIIEEIGLDKSAPEAEFLAQLRPRQLEITLWGYEKILGFCQEFQAVPIWVFLPSIDDNETKGEQFELEQKVAQMGFQVLNLESWQKGHEPDSLKIAPWDSHPNARAHQLIAEEFLNQLHEKPELIEALRQAAKYFPGK